MHETGPIMAKIYIISYHDMKKTLHRRQKFYNVFDKQ